MTVHGGTSSFYDWQAFDQPVFFTEAVPIAPAQVLVSTWLGRCFVLDLETRTRRAEPLAKSPFSSPSIERLVGNCLQSLSVTRDSPRICAVATRAGWASVWRLGALETSSVFPENGGPVNAVALSPRGDRLALGTGFYALNPLHDPRAFVELWDISASPVHTASRRLPGAVVDRLAWDADGEQLAVVTGALSQDRGHLALLDDRSLDILDIAEHQSRWCHALRIHPVDHAVVMAFGDRIEVRTLSELHEVEESWVLDGPPVECAFTNDGEEALLSNGLLLNPRSGRRRQLPALPDCTGVGVLPGGVGLGISQSGTVRVWRDLSNAVEVEATDAEVT